MCGLAGLVLRDGAPADPAVADRLDAALAHRGPDGRGRWRSPAGDVLLVHRRLAIIDPAPRGAQPLAAPGGEVIVFNGEVYNFRDLRVALEQRGESFRTETDTEVLLRLVTLDGPAALARVRGMFALAVWNPGARTLLVARDRFGIKPLYVAADARRLAFASELGALRAAGLAGGAPSPAAVLAFLEWGSVPPPLAWTSGVEMLEPGSWLEWGQDGRERRGVFADLRDTYVTAAAAASEDVLRRSAAAAVRDSVRAHFVADVPVGVFLSGGIDSSAIVSAAASEGIGDLRTFTVTFDDPGDESGAARLVSTTFGTTHHELHVDASHVAEDFPRILDAMDQPTIDGVNTYYVSRAVRATGIKAVLSGVGGDELFGGYPSFRRIPMALRAARAAAPVWRAASPAVTAVLPPRLKPRWRHFSASAGDFAEAYRTQRGLFLRDEIDAMAGPALRDGWRDAAGRVDVCTRERLSAVGNESAVAAVARMESRLYMCSQLLRDIDVMAMRHGLEVRVPFVDHVLASAVWPAAGAHPALLRRKRLLSETLARPLPPGIADAPKRGFTLPFARWMKGPLAPLVRDGLDRLARAAVIAPGVPDAVWAAWQRGQITWARPWGLAVLGHFVAAGALASTADGNRDA